MRSIMTVLALLISTAASAQSVKYVVTTESGKRTSQTTYSREGNTTTVTTQIQRNSSGYNAVGGGIYSPMGQGGYNPTGR